jgi:gliding motility-associated-like protein
MKYKICQYRLDTINIPASRWVVGEVYNAQIGHIQHGPNKQVYFIDSPSGVASFLSKITNPHVRRGASLTRLIQPFRSNPPGSFGNIFIGLPNYPQHIFAEENTVAAFSLGPDFWLCSNQNTVLEAPEGYVYQWNTGATTQQITVQQPGAYILNIYSACGDFLLSDTIQIFQSSETINLGQDTLICSGSPLRLGTGVTAEDLIWSTGEKTDSITASVSGVYWVVARVSPAMCVLVDSITVLYDTPPAIAVTGDTRICTGEVAALTAIASGGASLQWSPGAATTPVIYVGAGEYAVTATSPAGCTQTATVSVVEDEAICDSLYWIPNVFTPNGDGFNDLFLPRIGKAVEAYQQTILDRWGRTMYVSNNLTHGWNGNDLHGSPCSPGVYFYVLMVTNPSGGRVVRKGEVVLVR